MRALRFPLQLAVEYRPVGKPDWHAAETANVSASGLLVLQTSTPPAVDTEIEFRLALTAPPSPAGNGEVLGRGHVVRQAAPADHSGGFAVAIDHYDFFPVNPVRLD